MPRAWSSARYTIPLPEGHRFPMAKYAMIRDAVAASGVLAGGIEEPDRVERWALGLAHTPEWIDAIMDGTISEAQTRRVGFPWSAELRERSLRTVQATVEAARDALAEGWGVTLAGGTHHAFADRGEGFCVFNDVAVAIRLLQREGRIQRAAVIDLDVHQGNGTAAIFSGDQDVFTFSMHGRKNYPFHKEVSRLDVELEDGCGDPEYLALLEAHLDDVLAGAEPHLVFYLGGADPYAGDRLGRLQLSIAGLARRDRMVFDACRRLGVPVVLTMAGGYAPDLGDVATIHCNSVRELVRAYH
ncbi:MAG TPA: histone deacetylase [Gemmatimonadales bacterium]|nr:histone deacetylase [Gemmatimonadales bacterium]